MPQHNPSSIHWNELVLPTLPTLRLGWRDALILIAGYVALDWASFIHPLHGLNITPWNPALALGLVFLLRFGKFAVPPLALAILMADIWVRHLPASLPLAMGLAALQTLGYWAIGTALRSRLARGGIFGAPARAARMGGNRGGRHAAEQPDVRVGAFSGESHTGG